MVLAAAKVLLSPPHPHPLCSLSFHANFHQLHPWLRWQPRPPTPKKLHVSLQDPITSSSSALAVADYITHQQLNPNSLVLLADGAGYSLASYYTSLGLFVISVPGLWSLIKRSVKSKVIPVVYFICLFLASCYCCYCCFSMCLLTNLF